MIVKYGPWAEARDSIPATRILSYTDEHLVTRFKQNLIPDFAALNQPPTLFVQEDSNEQMETYWIQLLQEGPLLTAELRQFAKYEGLEKDTHIQKSVCFTALTPSQLAHHATTFGSFSLEFEEIG